MNKKKTEKAKDIFDIHFNFYDIKKDYYNSFEQKVIASSTQPDEMVEIKEEQKVDSLVIEEDLSIK